MRAVCYFRVSTQDQGRSGLGLEAQRAAVAHFCKVRGCEVLGDYVEVESGKRDDRPQLIAALLQSRLTGSVLVIAKLDRLSRNIAFLTQLQEAGIKFIAADMPEANELTIHIMAAVAQSERKAIATRTSEALRAAKERGRQLGNPNGAAALRRAGKGNVAAVTALKRDADRFAGSIAAEIERLRSDGFSTFDGIAEELNRRRVCTRRGATWHASTVRNVLRRLDANTKSPLNPAPRSRPSSGSHAE